LQPQDKTITVGFSGGADSTALLHLLILKQKFFNYKLQAVVFTHGDSPIAEDENKMLDFCKNFCKENNVTLTQVDLDLEKIPRQGWESSGRQARQSYYKDIVTDYVFLGHHQDDQNETTMTQLLRGGGKGTTAMNPSDGYYCRPFLNIHKKDIYDYLTANKINWIEDPTNTDIHFTRNFWRKIGLPTIEQHYPQYSQTLEKFRKKQSELYSLAYEMALTDGLQEILKGNTVSIKNLNDVRLKNLLNYVFTEQNKNMEDAFYDQQVSHYRVHNKLDIEQKGLHLYLYKNMIQQLPPTQNLDLGKTLKIR
jgi:tRNA(Ile)-lysidine synthetase-like protein